ncbi:TatD family hydrolase [Acetohalobium arabaticum]|uniref:Hydrolase, TatD family n=1 Tax=Acetohalobium arabaticum (strain ATCC 49924 / DSM 5501 / Z-7288) TaxID=574087 RepID=D9QSR8_ACEAZ|nr:TatD family hydrolase [Acetohalobium arabaticum]ADL11606.1 hydrolase, TatD family [Acetohalobium arabaticum DSM 5501]
MLVDTHAHIDFPRFDDDRDKVIKRAKENNLEYIINVGADEASSQRSVELAQHHDMIYAVVGVHPHEAKSVTEETYSRLKEWAAEDKVVAIGETGLDYHYDNSPRQVQQQVFRRHIRLAKEVDLPLVIHSREAEDQTMELLKEEEAEEVGGIIHCFPGDQKMANQALDLNFYIAVGGILTFNNSYQLQRVVKQIPLDRLLLETDAPYLTPEPNRGKRNEPAYIKYVADKLAQILPHSTEKIAAVTTENAKEAFSIA